MVVLTVGIGGIDYVSGDQFRAAHPWCAAASIIAPATGAMPVPAIIADLGEAAALRFTDFFTANVRNPNTRAAYAVAVRGFFAWLEKHGVRELGAVRTHH